MSNIRTKFKKPRKVISRRGLGPVVDADRSIRVQGVPLSLDLTTTRNERPVVYFVT